MASNLNWIGGELSITSAVSTVTITGGADAAFVRNDGSNDIYVDFMDAAVANSSHLKLGPDAYISISIDRQNHPIEAISVISSGADTSTAAYAYLKG